MQLYSLCIYYKKVICDKMLFRNINIIILLLFVGVFVHSEGNESTKGNKVAEVGRNSIVAGGNINIFFFFENKKDPKLKESIGESHREFYVKNYIHLREDVFSKLLKVAKPSEKSIVRIKISGEAGSGKSFMAKNLVDQITKQSCYTISWPIDATTKESFMRLIRNIGKTKRI